jgi:thiamine pyrophosphokinase
LRALIVADGDMPARDVIDRLIGSPDDGLLIVAADGGSLKAEQRGLSVQVTVGDVDSLAPAEVDRLRGAGVEVIVHPAAKDESDTELAVREAIRRGAQSIVVVGAFGGRRIEHTLANVLLLTLPELAGMDVVLADGASTVRAISGGHASLDLEGTARSRS